ncbi:MAG: hypothetical protein N3F62_02590 [Bacteroidia bacterium]|nr:hypothetical protein [Bacteroidia bacterium]
MYRFFVSLILILIIFIFDSCSFQKRLYRKGYYVDWTFSKNFVSKSIQQTEKQEVLYSENSLKPNQVFNISNYLAPKEIISTNDNRKTFNKTSFKSYNKKDTCGDKLILKSGDEFVVKIIEISDKEIKYKRCDNYDGPLYTISKSKVYAIVYSNGITEHIIDDSIISKSNEEKAQSSTKDKRKAYPGSYWWTWVLFVVGFFSSLAIFTWPYALYSARKARREIRNNSNQYRGYIEMGIIMYFILICFILLALMCIVLGVMLIFTPQILGVTGMSALAILVGVLLLVLGIGITAFLNEFFKTSDRSDF